MTFPIQVAQLDFVTGDVAGNARRITEAAQQADADGARVLLTTALALCGPHPLDLLKRPVFALACQQAMGRLCDASHQWPGMALVVGCPAPIAGADSETGRLHNTMTVIRDGRVIARAEQAHLAPGACGAGLRYFEAGCGVAVFDVDDVRVGVVLGADLAPTLAPPELVADLLLVGDAAPFDGDAAGWSNRWNLAANQLGLPLVVAAAVGGQDALVFSGGSVAVAADGMVAARAPLFAESSLAVSVGSSCGALNLSGKLAAMPDADSTLWQALVLALRDYVQKNGFESVALGLSGGMDSALVLALAVDALGAERVHTVTMPSPYTASISLEDAFDMARRLGVPCEEVSIAPVFEQYKHTLAPLMADKAEDTTEENLQARIRGMILMALSNKHGHLILATGNKSEVAVGYATLYGDMCGGFAPIMDVLKTRVYQLARWRNAHDLFGTGANPIPERIITRAPSAELRPDQTDQDSLPPYDVLDAIIEGFVEQGQSAAQLRQRGFDATDVQRVLRLIRFSEYKRQQGAVGPRVTSCSLGADWHWPITNRFDEFLESST